MGKSTRIFHAATIYLCGRNHLHHFDRGLGESQKFFGYDEEEIYVSLRNQTRTYILYPVTLLAWAGFLLRLIWRARGSGEWDRFVTLCGNSAVFVVNPIAMEINGDKLSLRCVRSKVVFVCYTLFPAVCFSPVCWQLALEADIERQFVWFSFKAIAVHTDIVSFIKE